MTSSDDANPRKRDRIAIALLACFAVGVLISVGVAWLIFASSPAMRSDYTLTASADNEEIVSVNTERGFGSLRLFVTREAGLAWSSMRAVGPPDVPMMGDNSAAWASLSQDAQQEWLELSYATPTVPTTVVVYENLAPGAVFRVTAFDERGNEIELWRGSDPAQPGANGVFVAKFPMQTNLVTSRIRLYLDSPRVKGWNEIDAVGLVQADDTTQWAQSARASSTYASQNNSSSAYTMKDLVDAVPGWVKIPQPIASATPISQTRVLRATGWPMLTMYSEAASPPVPTGNNKMLSLSGLSPPPSPAAMVATMPLPLNPIWRGLAGNGMIYGLALAALYLSTFRLRRVMLESSRLRRGCCIRCGYDVRYDFPAGCPECGWNRLPEPARGAEREVSRV